MQAAADYNRLTADWRTEILSANADLRGGFRRLRGASRSLFRDTAHGARFRQLIQENVVGAHGVRLQARVGKVRDGTPNKALNDQLEDAWKEWSAPGNASYDGRLSLNEIAALAVSTTAQDGEVLVRMIRGARNEFSFALQILDADLLDEELGMNAPVRLPNGNEIRMGIEEDRTGRPQAYWLWTAHPTDPTQKRERQRVKADDIIHLFVTLRPGQIRGIPWATPVLVDQKMYASFQEAAVVAARFGASKMAIVTTDPEKATDLGDTDQALVDYVDEVSPGGVWRTNPGESVDALDFQYPNTAFGEFSRTILQSIASGYGVSHASLTGDLSGVNYSSIRAGLLQERDSYRRLQQWVITHFYHRVFCEWVKYAPLSGRIPARESSVYRDVRWQPRGWVWVDPLKEMSAAVIAVDNGFTTRTAVCGESGDDFEENVEVLASEQQLTATLGVTLGSAKAASPAVPTDATQGADDAGDDAEDPPSGAMPPGKVASASKKRLLLTGTHR